MIGLIVEPPPIAVVAVVRLSEVCTAAHCAFLIVITRLDLNCYSSNLVDPSFGIACPAAA